MGWANCGTDDQGRPIGYAHEAECDESGCSAEIDRGLAYVCGNMHGGDGLGCGKYFCADHLILIQIKGHGDEVFQVCRECAFEIEKEANLAGRESK